MELNTIQHLCKLSRLKYNDEELKQLTEQMSDIIALMDEIKNSDLEYDDTKDNNSIPFSQVREDVVQPSASQDKLLANAKTCDSCYIVPKVVD